MCDSALMERLVMGGESEMVTMYHPDGDRLMMTHYCSAHNQPRMHSQTVAGGSKIITFDLVDVTNLSAPDAGHMKKLGRDICGQGPLHPGVDMEGKGKENAVVIRFERNK